MKRWMAYMLCVCLMMMGGCAAAGEESLEIISVEYKKADLEPEWDEKDVVNVTFDGGLAEISGSGAQMDGDVLVIVDEGDYRLSGEFDGRIVVDAGKKEKVRLILSGLRLTSPDSAAVFIRKADKATVTLEDGSENTIIAGSNLLTEKDEELDAALYSKADLVINGGGSLNVGSPNGHGILSKDDLRLIGGTIYVHAGQDGVRGRDAIQMKGGMISIAAGGDGMRSNNDEDEDRGYISIDGGEISISAGGDGIIAETAIQVLSGTIRVEEAYEGMEAQRILIAGGETDVRAVEDGINASGGEKEGEDWAMFEGGSEEIEITGGILHIDAGGDGIDSNGTLRFAGGEVYVSGPTDDRNGALDSSGKMTISGGILLAAGSSGMASAPQADGQVSTMLQLGQTQPGGAAVSVKSASGEELAAFTPEKDWTSIVISVPGIAEGEEIQLFVNDGLVMAAKAGENMGRGMNKPGSWFR